MTGVLEYPVDVELISCGILDIFFHDIVLFYHCNFGFYIQFVYKKVIFLTIRFNILRHNAG